MKKNSIKPHFSRQRLTVGQRLADWLTKWAGSWTFIFLFFVFLISWMTLNTYALFFGVWDPYPFILLNLALSCLAAVQAPVILMSQNRAAERDRQRAEHDYYINRKAEREIKIVQKHILEMKETLLKQDHTGDLKKINEEIKKIQEELDDVTHKIIKDIKN